MLNTPDAPIEQIIRIDETHRIKIVQDAQNEKRYVPQYCLPHYYPSYVLETWVNYRPGDMQLVDDALFIIAAKDPF